MDASVVSLSILCSYPHLQVLETDTISNASLPMNTLNILAGRSSIKCWYPRL
jgi:hypothetical protein